MGNSLDVIDTAKKDHKFGGYKSSDKPRPGYYKTPIEVYYRGALMTEADQKTFKKLGNSYGKDSNNVYYKGKILPGADKDTFAVNGNVAYDKSGEWYLGSLVKGSLVKGSLSRGSLVKK